MIQVVSRLHCAPRERGAILRNAPRLIEFFEGAGVRSAGVFENFSGGEIVHVWQVESMAAFEEATRKLREDPDFRAFAAEAGKAIDSETKEFWRGMPLAASGRET